MITRLARMWAQRALDDLAADVGLGAFRHRGVRVIHAGVLVDQKAIADRIDEELGLLGPRVDITCLSRVRVYIAPNRATDLTMAARWTGGLCDRGEARVEDGESTPDLVAAAVVALIGVEQGTMS